MPVDDKALDLLLLQAQNTNLYLKNRAPPGKGQGRQNDTPQGRQNETPQGRQNDTPQGRQNRAPRDKGQGRQSRQNSKRGARRTREREGQPQPADGEANGPRVVGVFTGSPPPPNMDVCPDHEKTLSESNISKKYGLPCAAIFCLCSFCRKAYL
jgi:hypothetical protein